MKEKSTNHKIIENFCAHIFDLLFGIPSIVTAIGWVKRIICKSDYTLLEIFLSVIVILNALIWIFIVRNYYGYPNMCRKTQYTFISKTFKYYRRSDDDSLDASRILEVKSNVNGLDRIKERFLWTGDSDANFPKRGKNVISIHPEESIGIWKYFSVNFNQVISKGNTLKVAYKWPRIKNCTSSSPFVSTDTEYETKKLVFEVNLGKEYANHELMLEEYRSIESECPISVTCVQFDDVGGYKWEIEKPKRYRYFRMRWTWNTDNQNDEES